MKQLQVAMVLLGVFLQAQGKCAQETVSLQKRHIITVFVHGTSRPFLSMRDFFKVLHGTTHNSLYTTIVNTLRNDNYFYQAQPIQQLGLHPICPHDLATGKAANLVGHLYELQYRKLNNNHQEGSYYTFGWSGLLSVQARREAAEELYHALHTILETSPEQPLIQVIGYSHGGNVALYLAEAEARHQKNLTIDKLILLGTPVQNDTDYLISSSMFTHTYNIYSTGDLVQTVDFLSSSRHSLGRHAFRNRPGFCVPDNLRQIRVRVVSQGKKYYGKKTTGPYGRRKIIANPGHTELWFFGWAMEWYRKTFPLYPFSIAHFIPLLVSAADRCSICTKCNADIHVDQGTITFCKNNCHRKCCPFIRLEEIHKWGAEILQYKPDIDEKSYKCRVKKAIKQAKAFYKKQRETQLQFEPIYSPARQRQIFRRSLIPNC